MRDQLVDGLRVNDRLSGESTMREWIFWLKYILIDSVLDVDDYEPDSQGYDPWAVFLKLAKPTNDDLAEVVERVPGLREKAWDLLITREPTTTLMHHLAHDERDVVRVRAWDYIVHQWPDDWEWYRNIAFIGQTTFVRNKAFERLIAIAKSWKGIDGPYWEAFDIDFLYTYSCDFNCLVDHFGEEEKAIMEPQVWGCYVHNELSLGLLIVQHQLTSEVAYSVQGLQEKFFEADGSVPVGDPSKGTAAMFKRSDELVLEKLSELFKRTVNSETKVSDLDHDEQKIVRHFIFFEGWKEHFVMRE